MNMYDSKPLDTPGAVGPPAVPVVPAAAPGGPAQPRAAEGSSAKGGEHGIPEPIVAVLATGLQAAACSSFPGACLLEDVRAIRGADVPFTMLREGRRS